MKIARILLADALFYLGHKLVVISALTMGYKDTAIELKKSQAYWVKEKAFRLK